MLCLVSTVLILQNALNVGDDSKTNLLSLLLVPTEQG